MRLRMLSMSALAVVALLLAACGDDTTTSDESQRDESGGVVEEGEVGAFVIQVGDCFDDPGEEVSSVPAVPCDEPHENEAFALFDLEGDDEWPGQETIRADAEAGCIERFEAYVGTPYAESALFSRAIAPSEDTWTAGDREVICVLFDPSGDVTGSAEGSNL